ncbi:hypothetical protein XENOCAPTIV_005169 [Xenoophorus captivus]|uniref:Uncharacterized protein n=1 Tax=Xenoophorus captivus TaxID=1517983 RepID=A0ABV0R794_9TELE
MPRVVKPYVTLTRSQYPSGFKLKVSQPAVLLKPQDNVNGQNTKWLSTGERQVSMCVGVCVCVYEDGCVETPYLGIVLPPLLSVLLVLLQGGPGLPLQAARLPLLLLDQVVLFRVVLLL